MPASSSAVRVDMRPPPYRLIAQATARIVTDGRPARCLRQLLSTKQPGQLVLARSTDQLIRQ
ncbi:MAG: hypothetical protein HOA60_03155 [Rhodospirillales bacterium]|nr:hypothetical protein [Rhodospirillales bacterium]